MKKVAIVQSNYIPWKGYFDLINSVDEFVLYDDMQYTRRDWRNRNKIKMPQGPTWLTIPVEVKGKYFQKINETRISDSDWAKQHWSSIKQCYSKAPYFKQYSAQFEDMYLSMNEEYLSQVNFKFIQMINDILGITTKLSWSSEFVLEEGQTEKLLGICRQAGAECYISGPAAKDYFNEDTAQEMGIKVEWMDYSDYPEYPQLFEPFEHGVSILDLIFNVGPSAQSFMKSFKK